MTEVSPGTIAASNVLQAISAALMGAGQLSSVSVMLNMLEGMNELLAPFPADRDAMEAAIRMQRQIVAQMGG